MIERVTTVLELVALIILAFAGAAAVARFDVVLGMVALAVGLLLVSAFVSWRSR